MKTGSKIFLFFLACLSTACIHSGFDWDLPKFAVVETTAPVNILDVTAISGGNVVNDGGSAVQERGVCLSVQVTPTIADTVVVCNKGIGTFTATLQGLKALTTYYLRAYATTKAGTAYGNESTFKTLGFASLTTSPVGSLTMTTAVLGGSIVSGGGTDITERGICFSTSKVPTTAATTISSGSGLGDFSVTVSDLTTNTTYYVRAYAINIVGTMYGNEISFTTASLATLTTVSASQITQTGAKSGGAITYAGSTAVSLRGICFDINSNPTILNNIVISGTGTGNFTSTLTGLVPGTQYFVRAFATNSSGTAYGDEVSFTTNPVLLPAVSTTSASSVTKISAVSGGNVTNDGGGTILVRGICYGTSHTPTIAGDIVENGGGSGSFTDSMSGLMPGTIYYVRAFATNSAGTAYGNEVNFTTLPELKLGQSYKGGLIFYLDDTTLHGLIASTYDQSAGAAWGCSGTLIPGSQGLVQGTGLANTNAIQADCTTAGIAARICADLVSGGYSDWYLPSRDELSLMHDNLKLKGLAGFANSSYWSSSEYSATGSYMQSFLTGVIGQSAKSSLGRVRAIRNF